MATLDWQQDRTGGVTLVELVVRSGRDERVRVDSRLEPVWPPRRQGVPAAGWDETGYEGEIEADSRLVLGYASPAEPADPPAELTEPRAATEEVTAHDLLRTLGEAGPPRDAVAAVEATSDPDERVTPELDDRPTRSLEGNCDKSDLATWFEGVEERLAAAERLATADDVEEAHDAIAAAGGIEGVRNLQARLDADARQLDRFGDRRRELQQRVEAVEIPLEALERLG